jgi:hypothetical protein
MQELIESIRAAVASGANTEHKAAGVTACRTILTALDTEPGKPLAPALPPIVVPSASPLQGLSKLSLDQMLDLLIARLSMVANAREANQPTRVVQNPPNPPAATASVGASRGLRVPPALPQSAKGTPKSAGVVRKPGSRP